MKNVLKNFLMYVSRFKLASSLNILGLATAFTVFILISAQLYWEFSFNRGIKDSDKIHVLLTDIIEPGVHSDGINRPIGELLGKSSPAIEDYTTYWEDGMMALKSIGQAVDVQEHFAKISLNFIDMFGVETIDGDLKQMSANKVLISESMAKKYFPNTSAIGGQIVNDKDVVSEIVGVYKDFAENSSFENGIFRDLGNESIDRISEWSYCYFYKFTDDVNMAEMKKVAVDGFLANIPPGAIERSEVEESFSGLKFTSLENTYYEGGFGPKGNKALSLILLSVALLIIIIASINYVNLFMALVPIRIRNINISKVFGASDSTLRNNIVFEGVGIALIGFLLALPAVELLSGQDICSYTSASLKLADNLGLVSVVGIIAVGVGLIAGIFPSFYITAFSPALVLKGSFGRSAKGRGLRAVLTSFQFIVSVVLIIVAMFIMLQNKYMEDADYGIDKESVINTRLIGKWDESKIDALKSEISNNPMIEGVSFSDMSIFNIGMTWGRKTPAEESMNFVCLPTSWDYPEFMGMELVEGRFFVEDDRSKPGGTMIFNETAAKLYGLKIGDILQGHSSEHEAEIVGIVKDFNFSNLSDDIGSVCLYEFGSDGWRIPSYLNIRLAEGEDADLSQVREHIQNSMFKINPDINKSLIRITSLNDDIEDMYWRERRLSKVINVFSAISILISLLGLFGIIVFETQYRRKEVALRKIHGSSIGEILQLFSMQSVRVLVVSSLIAIPIAWFLAHTWLSTHAYRIPVYWWVFPIAVLLVFSIVMLIVISQTYRTASEDPKRNLKDN